MKQLQRCGQIRRRAASLVRLEQGGGEAHHEARIIRHARGGGTEMAQCVPQVLIIAGTAESCGQGIADVAPDPKLVRRHGTAGQSPLVLLQRAVQPRGGERADMDAAIGLLQEAVDLTPEGATARTARLCNLAGALRPPAERYGDLEDLDHTLAAY